MSSLAFWKHIKTENSHVYMSSLAFWKHIKTENTHVYMPSLAFWKQILRLKTPMSTCTGVSLVVCDKQI